MSIKCHQIWISDNNEITPIIAQKTAHTQNFVGESNYKLWTKKDALQLLGGLDHNILTTFNSIIPQAYKADFLRYVLIYNFGRLYIDAMARLNVAYANIVDTNRTLVFKDYFAGNHAPWNVSNGCVLRKL
jgi:mannosyltransferase OCH1-like enzyme